MSAPIDRLLDGLDWQELPPPEHALVVDGDLPYATHEGTLAIGEIELRCYTLSDGTRVFDADSVVEVFGDDR